VLYGVLMNLWFWPFLASGAPAGTAFVAGDPWRPTSLGTAPSTWPPAWAWDLPRGC
jgi:energy-coupling factor transport system substrate-specific component